MRTSTDASIDLGRAIANCASAETIQRLGTIYVRLLIEKDGMLLDQAWAHYTAQTSWFVPTSVQNALRQKLEEHYSNPRGSYENTTPTAKAVPAYVQ